MFEKYEKDQWWIVRKVLDLFKSKLQEFDKEHPLFDDDGRSKDSLIDWVNAELISNLAFDI